MRTKGDGNGVNAEWVCVDLADGVLLSAVRVEEALQPEDHRRRGAVAIVELRRGLEIIVV